MALVRFSWWSVPGEALCTMWPWQLLRLARTLPARNRPAVQSTGHRACRTVCRGECNYPPTHAPGVWAGRIEAVRLARALVEGQPVYGWVEGPAGSEVLVVLDGDPLQGPCQTVGKQPAWSSVQSLPPVAPSKIIAVGRNYAEHVAEMGAETPAFPRVFFKPLSAVIATGEAIEYPALSQEVHHEAELAVVIGRRCRYVPPDEVHSVVFGYTCANDVTARDIQRASGETTWAKCFDTFCPLGPWVTTVLDATDLAIHCMVNGDVRQDSRTSALIYNVPALVSHISQAMTLLPGDVILTGTPAGVSAITPGDEVTVTIEGIGSLT